MKVYLYITKQKQALALYKPYRDALTALPDITSKLEDADTLLILGAWSRQGARLARRARRMGIPYTLCPLGDLSPESSRRPWLKRGLQALAYQRRMTRGAALVLATTPLEQQSLARAGLTGQAALLRYFAYSSLTTQDAQMDSLDGQQAAVLARHEQQKAEAIARQTEHPIARQLLQIKSRMPHQNIPQSYLDKLHGLLYAEGYDEDALCAELHRLGLSAYAAAVFQVMSERTGLTEGFMPLPAQKSRKSKEILRFVK